MSFEGGRRSPASSRSSKSLHFNPHYDEISAPSKQKTLIIKVNVPTHMAMKEKGNNWHCLFAVIFKAKQTNNRTNTVYLEV